jgi:hypothetical protein
MSDTTINIIYLLIVILVPAIPAFLLFKSKGLQSSAAASGPLKGFAIKLGGAFAGYFIVFLILYYKLPNEFAPPGKSEWRVKAILKDQDGESLDASARPIIKLKPMDREVENCRVDISLPPKFKSENELDYKLWIEDENAIYSSSKKFDLIDSALKFKDARIIDLGTIKLTMVRKDDAIAIKDFKIDTLKN